MSCLVKHILQIGKKCCITKIGHLQLYHLEAVSLAFWFRFTVCCWAQDDIIIIIGI